MNKFKFSSLNLGHLSVDAIYSLNESTIVLAQPLSSSFDGVMAVNFNQLVSANAALGKGLRQGQKNLITDELSKLDADRDADIRVIFRTTRSYQRRADPQQKSAANTLMLFLGSYKGLESLPLDVETRVVNDMLGKYSASDELKAAAVTLGVEPIFASLENKNNIFAERYKQRNTEVVARATSGWVQKPAAKAAYQHFCSSLEIVLNYTPDAVLEALFYKMDDLRKKYHQIEGKSGTDTPDTPATT